MRLRIQSGIYQGEPRTEGYIELDERGCAVGTTPEVRRTMEILPVMEGEPVHPHEGERYLHAFAGYFGRGMTVGVAWVDQDGNPCEPPPDYFQSPT